MLDVSFVDDDPKRTPGALTFKFGFGPDVFSSVRRQSYGRRRAHSRVALPLRARSE
jgi:hypothetical protein